MFWALIQGRWGTSGCVKHGFQLRGWVLWDPSGHSVGMDKATTDAVDRRGGRRPSRQTSFNTGLVWILPDGSQDHCGMEAVEDGQGQRAAQEDSPW